MALTRKFLKAMGVEDEKIDQIIEAHSETVEGLKAYKTDAEKLPGVQAELDSVKADLAAVQNDGWKGKYDTLKQEYDTFKAEAEAKESNAAKTSAYEAIIKEVGISDKLIKTILKGVSLGELELVDGKLKDADKIKNDLKSEYEDFIVKEQKKGDTTPNPSGGGKTMTKDDISKMFSDGSSREARRAAIAENLNLYNKGEE